MHDVVDLRSDTLTLPTPAMREAMAKAEVGDDVWEEDPTVQRLEALAAERTGKEAGLFVASGTMGNLVSVLSQTRPGQEIILDLDSHIFNYEVASAAVIGGVQTRPIRTERGFLSPDQVREAIRPANIHIPPTGLVCLENTHNRHGGTVCAPEEIAAVAAVAHAAAVPVHLDGPRRWARWFAGPVISSPARGAAGRCWAAGCARSACWRRRGWWRWSRWWSGSPGGARNARPPGGGT